MTSVVQPAALIEAVAFRVRCPYDECGAVLQKMEVGPGDVWETVELFRMIADTQVTCHDCGRASAVMVPETFPPDWA
jgi:ribosomal protein S27E